MKHLNALNTIYGLGCKKMKILMEFFGSAEEIWKAPLSQLIDSGIGEKIAKTINEARPGIDPEIEWAKLEKENVIAVSIEDDRYPKLLREIPDNPYLIYMKGNLDCLDLPLVAIVGSRKLTTYGSQVARSFARDLANSGVCVVSGLAFGIDAMAHRGALDAKGKTIAVLGNSLDEESISPRTNFQLSEEILRCGGLLISEFPIQTHADSGTFPARNRIMAGMSQGVLVVEAAIKSGTIITVNLALDYNRDVFAVPGSIFSPQSEGTHKIIKAGAKLVTCAKDIMEELRIENFQELSIKKIEFDLTEDEKNLCSILSHESLHIDFIAKMTRLDTSTVSSMLAILEIKGAIKNVGGQNYIKT
jgi:DNA processing protein